MSLNPISDAEFLEKLNAHPILKQQFYSLVLSIEDESGTLRKADAEELQIIEQMRQMGNASLTAWADHQHERESEKWIADQVEKQFGAQGRYLVDFYHLCDYLSAAAKAIESRQQGERGGMETHKENLKHGEWDKVLKALQTHIEEPEVDDEEPRLGGVIGIC